MTGRPRLAWDCRRRFLESFAETVLGRDPAPLAAQLAALVASEGVINDRELDSEALERLAASEQAMLDVSDGCPVKQRLSLKPRRWPFFAHG